MLKIWRLEYLTDSAAQKIQVSVYEAVSFGNNLSVYAAKHFRKLDSLVKRLQDIFPIFLLLNDH